MLYRSICVRDILEAVVLVHAVEIDGVTVIVIAEGDRHPAYRAVGELHLDVGRAVGGIRGDLGADGEGLFRAVLESYGDRLLHLQRIGARVGVLRIEDLHAVFAECQAAEHEFRAEYLGAPAELQPLIRTVNIVLGDPRIIPRVEAEGDLHVFYVGLEAAAVLLQAEYVGHGIAVAHIVAEHARDRKRA